MRAIIIDEKDCRQLLERLELEIFHLQLDRSLMLEGVPERTRFSLIEEMHYKFHYVVTSWLQDQGVEIYRRSLR